MLAPKKPARRAVTPESVKALIIIEAIGIAFLGFWTANEYVYNVYFRIYVNSVFVEHLTTYTVALGLGIGLAGTAVATILYKGLREAKTKLDSVAPKIRGSVEKVLSSIPAVEPKRTLSEQLPVLVSKTDGEASKISTRPLSSTTSETQEEKK